MVEWHVVGRMVVMVDHRRTGWGGGVFDPPKFGQIRHLFGQKTTHLFD